MSGFILTGIAAELSSSLGIDHRICADRTEHHDGKSVWVHYSLGVYLSEPFASVVLFHDCNEQAKEGFAAAEVDRRAREWLAAGQSLRDIGAPLCEPCDEDHERMRVATDEHCGRHYCADCLDAASEAAYERQCEDYYGGSGPLTMRQQADVDARDGWKLR